MLQEAMYQRGGSPPPIGRNFPTGAPDGYSSPPYGPQFHPMGGGK